jgi:hypothetical protein
MAGLTRVRLLITAAVILLSMSSACVDKLPQRSSPAATEISVIEIGNELLRIGQDDSRAGHSLFGVRAALLHPDGRLITTSANEIRIFDPNGVLLGVGGGTGPGPAEFRPLAGLWLVANDTVLAYGTGRLTYWTTEPNLIRSLNIDIPTGATVLGRFDSGEVAYVRRRTPMTAGRSAGETWIDSVAVELLSEQSQEPRSLGRFPHTTMYVATLPDGGLLSTGLFYAAAGAFAAGRDRVYQGFGDIWQLVGYSSSGIAAEVLTRPVGPPAFPAAVRQSLIEERLSQATPEEAPALRVYLERLPYPEYLPAFAAFAAVLIDDLQCVWVHHSTLGNPPTAAWSIFTKPGQWLGDVDLPVGWQLMHVGSDFVVSLDRDALDVENVVVRTMHRNVGASRCT